MNFKEQHILTALELRIQEQDETFNALENKAGQYINISGLIITIIGGFVIIGEESGLFEKLIISLLLILFIYVLYHALKVLRPGEWKQVINSEWLSFAKSSLDLPYYEAMLHNYNKAILFNDDILLSKSRNVSRALKGLTLQLAVVFVVVLISIWI